jgi:hypothetical protein
VSLFSSFNLLQWPPVWFNNSVLAMYISHRLFLTECINLHNKYVLRKCYFKYLSLLFLLKLGKYAMNAQEILQCLTALTTCFIFLLNNWMQMPIKPNMNKKCNKLTSEFLERRTRNALIYRSVFIRGLSQLFCVTLLH